MCRRIAGSSRDGDDACQEALIKIVRNLPRFDGRSSFGTWAYRIATNASLDELRKRNRRPGLASDDEHATADVADPLAGRRLDDVSDRLVLDDALSALPDDLRAAVVLRDVADLDYGEIADVLDIPVGTVKSRISRGRAALARSLRLDAEPHRDTHPEPEPEPDPEPEPSRQDPDDDGNRTDPDERPTHLR